MQKSNSIRPDNLATARPELAAQPEACQSFKGRLEQARAEARQIATRDDWEDALRRLRGTLGSDGVERVLTRELFDWLDVPLRKRPSQTVRLSRIMQDLGWTRIRARGLTPGSYLDRVRGYARFRVDGDQNLNPGR